jgi:hypothetical protein
MADVRAADGSEVVATTSGDNIITIISCFRSLASCSTAC